MNPSTKKLLTIGTVWPEPNSSAAGSRMLQLLKWFQAQKYELIFASSASKSPYSADLKALGIREVAIKLNDSSFDTFVKTLNPDIVIFDRFMTEEQFGWRVAEACPNAIRILDSEDLHFLRHARGEIIKNLDKNIHSNSVDETSSDLLISKNALFQDLITSEIRTSQDISSKNNRVSEPLTDAFSAESLLNNEIIIREVASIYRCDLSLVISKFEHTLLTKFLNIPEEIVYYLPYLLDINDLNNRIKNVPEFEERQHFVSIGNFFHEPNTNAVFQLKHRVWPKIRASLPQAELHIYGAYSSAKIQQLHDEKSRFIVKGRADDAIETLSVYRVLLAPLRFGAGLKGKIVDSFTGGTAVVTTSIGVEGFEPYLSASDDVDTFAKAAISMYQKKSEWTQNVAKGQEMLCQFLNSAKFTSGFAEKINYLTNSLTKHRMLNLSGRILMHHTVASTKYMSRWIEAKNAKSDK